MSDSDRRPNVLFIQDDQHHAGLMSCAGHADVRTPQLDRIAAGGARFTRAFCPSAICQASRVSLFTGQATHTTGDYENSGLIRPDLRSLVDVMRADGYQTAALGKMHFIPQWPLHGFEVVRRGDFCDCTAMEQNEYYQRLRAAGQEQYYDLTGDSLKWGELGAWPSRLPLELTQEAWLADVTCEFLERRDRDRPFFCWSTFSRPHNPWSPSPPYDTMYDPADLTLPPTDPDDWKGKPFRGRDRWHDDKLIFYYPRMTGPALRRALACYYGLISQIDWAVGRILDRLDALGLADDTIVIFTSDHGELAGDHGVIDKGIPTVDAVWRVPLLIAAPGRIQPAQVREQLVNLTDLMPTVFDLCGLELPASAEGRSLAAEIDRPDWPGRDAVFFEYRMIKTVRTRDFAMTYYSPGEPDKRTFAHSAEWARGGELYDLRSDPNQFRNVFDDPAYRDVRLELTERLLEWFCNTEPVHRMSEPARPPRDSEMARFPAGHRFGRTPEQNREFYFKDHPGMA